MVSSLRRSKRTVGRRIIDIQSRVSRLQRRPAPRRLGPNAVTPGTIAPGAIPPAALDPAILDGINTDINNAQFTADGKNRVFYAPSSSIPTSSAAGDLWFNTTENYKMYRAAAAGVNTIGAGAWVGFTLGNDAIASISATKITAGSLDAGVIVTSNLDAGKITAGILLGIEVRVGTFSGFNTGLRLTSDGYLQGTGAGIKIKGYGTDGTNGTQTGVILFGDSITAPTVNADNVDATNQLEIGATSVWQYNFYPSSLTPAEFYNVDTSSTSASLKMVRWTPGIGNNPRYLDFFKATGPSNTESEIARININNAENGVTFVNCTATAPSDRRIKTVVDRDVDYLDAINRLTPVRYTWKNLAEKTEYTGLIAQELFEVIPEAVYVGDDLPETLLDENQGVKVQNQWSVDYSYLVSYLIGAVQKLSARVAELESK